MGTIRAVQAKEILDSRGIPSVHVSLWTDEGIFVESSIPNGNQHLPHEAFTLIDNDADHRGGRGVQKAIEIINQTLAPQLIGKDPEKQEELDQMLIGFDGTEQKTQYGANTLAALSQAIFKAGAATQGMSVYQSLFEKYRMADYLHIPTCIYGFVNGGSYGSGNLDLQEFLVIPASHVDYRVSLEIENTLREQLLTLLRQRKASYSTGILGGFTPSLQKNTDVFDFIIEAARKTEYILSRDFFFGIDAGAEHLLDRGRYVLRDRTTVYSEREMVEYYKNLKDQYNVTYFEDPFTFQNLELWKNFTADLGETTRIVMDSYTVSQPKRIEQAIQNQYANTVIIKPSQVGTVTEAIQAVKIAKASGWNVVVSQRSGETNDDFLADFSVGIGADFVKFGPTNRGEAVAKYNRLADIYIEIEQKMLQGEVPAETEMPAEIETSDISLQGAETPLPSTTTEETGIPLSMAPELPEIKDEPSLATEPKKENQASTPLPMNTPPAMPESGLDTPDPTKAPLSQVDTVLEPTLPVAPTSLTTPIVSLSQTPILDSTKTPFEKQIPATQAMPPQPESPALDAMAVQEQLNQVAQSLVNTASATLTPSVETAPLEPIPTSPGILLETTPPANASSLGQGATHLEAPAPEAADIQSAINSTLEELGGVSVAETPSHTSEK